MASDVENSISPKRCGIVSKSISIWVIKGKEAEKEEIFLHSAKTEAKSWVHLQEKTHCTTSVQQCRINRRFWRCSCFVNSAALQGKKCWSFENCKNYCLWRSVNKIYSAIIITSFAWKLAISVVFWHDYHENRCKLGPERLAYGIQTLPCWILNNTYCMHTLLCLCGT